MLKWLVLSVLFLEVFASNQEFEPKRTENGLHLPIYRQKTRSLRKRGDQKAAIGLGDYFDVTYNVLMNIGGAATPLVLDTGSSDLWVISDACTSTECSTDLTLYPQSNFQSTGLDAVLLYGDSLTGTHAYGPIGKDSVSVAGLTLQGQYFAAINDTNTSVTDTGSTGIFGLGFPLNSAIWSEVFKNEHLVTTTAQRRTIGQRATRFFPHIIQNLGRRVFPSLGSLYDSHSLQRRQSSPAAKAAWSTVILTSFASTGPFLPRLLLSDLIAAPLVTITLQRDSVDLEGNAGLMSIGELPDGVKNDSLTWAPLRTYTADQGGLYPPSDSPNEEYPIAWEIFIDDVYLDGEKLPQTSLTPSSIGLSALIDTGNSLIRGPSDIVELINSRVGSGAQNTFDCATPHTLAFEIGGKMFPIDPRDFLSQAFTNNVQECVSNVVETDSPVEGQGYMYSWSLGDPFLKSVLSSYYYGNLTYPSRDPPKIGFLSTVPDDAGDRLKAAVQAASGSNFPATSEVAPSGTPKVTATNSNGVPEVQATANSSSSGGNSNAAWRLLVGTESLCGVVLVIAGAVILL